MAVLACPHCGTVLIIVGGDPATVVCQQVKCRGVLELQETEPDISAAVRRALYSQEHVPMAATVITVVGP